MAGSRATYKKGLWAEQIAKLYLMLKGYRIVASRYKTPMGEIDIIARKANWIVFVEVKNRPSGDEGLFAVSAKSQGRIVNAARYYLADLSKRQKMGENFDFRFDVLAVSRFFHIRHLDNAWGETP